MTRIIIYQSIYSFCHKEITLLRQHIKYFRTKKDIRHLMAMDVLYTFNSFAYSGFLILHSFEYTKVQKQAFSHFSPHAPGIRCFRGFIIPILYLLYLLFYTDMLSHAVSVLIQKMSSRKASHRVKTAVWNESPDLILTVIRLRDII